MVGNNGLKKGDWVVHTYYGVGKITGKDEKRLNGKNKVFYKMKLRGGGWEKKDHLERQCLRPIALKNEIDVALQILKKPLELKHKDPLKWRGKIIDFIEDGSIYSHAKIIRSIFQLKVSGKADYWLRTKYSRFRNQFITEWALVEGEDKDLIKKKLKKVLKASSEKMKV